MEDVRMEEDAPPPAGPTPPQRAGMSQSMLAIMESQVEEMRRLLMRFRVCAATPTPEAGDPTTALPQQALPPHADILVFGPSGSGKSSLIRTFYMALHKTKEVPKNFADRIIVKDTAMNEGTLKYVSAEIKPTTLDHRGVATSSAILCHDTRGQIWMDERESRQLGVILDGNVKDDSLVQQRNYRYARLLWEFWRKDADLFPKEILVRQGGGLQTKPHAILFVFDGSMEEIPDGEEETRFYREVIAMTRAKGYLYPQIVLTRIDRVEEKLAKTATNDTGDPGLRLRQVLDKKIEDVVVKLDVSRTSVHFIENYHTGLGGCIAAPDRTVSVDFHALKILTQCCSHADAFVSKELRSAPRQGPCTLQ